MKILNSLKKLPIDLGQAEMKEKTKGKFIAFSFVPNVDKGKALDVGCRDGYWSEKLMKKGYDVESIDVDPRYSPAKKIDVNEGFPYKNESFNLIWCSEVLEHLKDPEQVLIQMSKLLKKDGIIVATVPNSHFWLMKIFYLTGLTPRKMQNSGHLHFFTKASFKNILPSHEHIYGYFPYAILKFKIKWLIGFLSPTFVAVITKQQYSETNPEIK